MHNLNATQSKHHAAIGGVALNWTHLENYVQSILWRMAGLDTTTGRCITHHMPFRSLCDAIVTIANETPKYQHLATDLEVLFRECDQLRVKRNDTVHALWGIFLHSEDAPLARAPLRLNEFEGMTIKARGSLNFKIKRTTIEKIDDISEEILAFSNRLADFVVANVPAGDLTLQADDTKTSLPDQRPI